MRQAKINGKWELWLPDHGADFHEAKVSVRDEKVRKVDIE